MATNRTITYSSGDRLEEISVEYVDDCDLPIDVSIPAVYSSIRLHVTLQSGAPLMDGFGNKFFNAIIDDGPNSKFHFEWPSTGIPEGNHTAVVRFTQADAKTLTIPSTKRPLLICVGPPL